MDALTHATNGWVSRTVPGIAAATNGWILVAGLSVITIYREVLELSSKITRRLMLTSKIGVN